MNDQIVWLIFSYFYEAHHLTAAYRAFLNAFPFVDAQNVIYCEVMMVWDNNL